MGVALGLALAGAAATSGAVAAAQDLRGVWQDLGPLSAPGQQVSALHVGPTGVLWSLAQDEDGQAALRRHSPDGALLSSEVLGPTDGEIRMFAIAPDGAGGVYVGGTVSGTGFGTPLGGYDFGLSRHAPDGSTLWSRRYGGAGADLGYDALADGSGGVYLCGRTHSDPAFGGPLVSFTGDGALLRVAPDGTPTWELRVGAAFQRTSLEALTRDANGDLLVVGGQGVPSDMDTGLELTVSAAGAVLTTTTNMPGVRRWLGAATHPSGDVYLLGEDDSDARGTLARRNAAGQVQWIVPTGTGLVPHVFLQTPLRELAFDLEGNLVLAGTLQEPGPGTPTPVALIERWTPQGAFLERRTYAPFGDADQALLHGVAVSPDGACYVGGLHRFGTATTDPGRPWLARVAHTELGVPGCAGQPNSTGAEAEAFATGSPVRADDSLAVVASGVPEGQPGYFLVSPTPGFSTPLGSQGNLCLAGSIGRFVQPGQIGFAGPDGTLYVDVDLASVPTPTGTVFVQPGQTWHYQAWYRDVNPGSTSNLSSSFSLTMQ